MAGREPGPNPDDWFDEPRVPDSRQRAPVDLDQTAVVDDWLTGDDGHGRRGFRIGDIELTPRQAALAAGAALFLILMVGLAVGGVFSSGGSTPAAQTSTPLTTNAATGTGGASSGPLPAVQGPTATLKPGDTGTQVKALQQALASLGYSPGKVDGAYGTGTQQALVAFQKAHNLAADGILGMQTLAALNTALAHSG